jgi:glycosyltransferase involved in cell wall biosynthesis
MKAVLLITDVNFWENSSGNRTRISSLIAYLALQVHLTVVNTGPAPENIEDVLSKKFAAEFFVLERTKYLSSTGYGRKLKAFLRSRHFDTVIIEYIHSSYFLNFLLEDTQVILDAHDIISNRTEECRKFNYPGSLYELARETEIELLNLYDGILALCQPDYDEISAIVGANKVWLCPHPVETCIHTIREEVKNIAFIASAYLPNQDAINWFIANCWPTISEKYGNVRLLLYGTVCGAIGKSLQEQIMCNGFVADRDKIYDEADIIINPVRFGAGLKIKNIEALAHGLPLVTTMHGARGIEPGINEAFLVADDAAGFIQSIESLIINATIRKTLRKNAHQFIKDRFSTEKCFKPLINIING